MEQDDGNLEAFLAECVHDSLNNYMLPNAVFLCERLHAARPSEVHHPPRTHTPVARSQSAFPFGHPAIEILHTNVFPDLRVKQHSQSRGADAPYQLTRRHQPTPISATTPMSAAYARYRPRYQRCISASAYQRIGV
jgi:hypothetical protein